MTHKAAWATYTATQEFAALSTRATHYKHVEGSLEAAFAAGRVGALEEAAKIAEQKVRANPKSDFVRDQWGPEAAAAIRGAKEQP